MLEKGWREKASLLSLPWAASLEVAAFRPPCEVPPDPKQPLRLWLQLLSYGLGSWPQARIPSLVPPASVVAVPPEVANVSGFLDVPTSSTIVPQSWPGSSVG